MSASVSSRELFEVSTTSGSGAGLDHAQLGDRDLEVGEDLEQHRLELLVGLVDLVDQQHDRAPRCRSPPAAAGSAGTPRRRCRRAPPPSPTPRRRRRTPPGSAAAACGSSTRTAPWPRRGPRSTAAESARGRWRGRAPWRARSCRRRPGPRPGPACRGAGRGRRRAPRTRRRGSRPRSRLLANLGDVRSGCIRCGHRRPDDDRRLVDNRCVPPLADCFPHTIGPYIGADDRRLLRRHLRPHGPHPLAGRDRDRDDLPRHPAACRSR